MMTDGERHLVGRLVIEPGTLYPDELVEAKMAKTSS